jgi:hypothetical protein
MNLSPERKQAGQEQATGRMDRRASLQLGATTLIGLALGAKGLIEVERRIRTIPTAGYWTKIERLDPTSHSDRRDLEHRLKELNRALHENGTPRVDLVSDSRFKAVLVRHINEFMKEHYQDVADGCPRWFVLTEIESIAKAARLSIFDFVPEDVVRTETRRCMYSTLAYLRAGRDRFGDRGPLSAGSAAHEFKDGIESLGKLTNSTHEELGISVADCRIALVPYVLKGARRISAGRFGTDWAHREAHETLKKLLEYCDITEVSIDTLPDVDTYRQIYLDALNLPKRW